MIIGRDGATVSRKPCTNSRVEDRRGWHFKALGCGIIFVHYTFGDCKMMKLARLFQPCYSRNGC